MRSPRRVIVLATACAFLFALLLATTTPAFAADATASLSDAPPAVPSPSGPPLPDFVATDEWQVVHPGQAVPPGLWVRMDMTTGERTARLLPLEERNDAARKREEAQGAMREQGEQTVALAVVPQADDEGNKDDDSSAPAAPTGPVIREFVPPALPGTAVDGQVPTAGPELGSHADLMSARIARLAALKNGFYLKEDVELMKNLLALCIDPASSVEQVVRALETLEELVHQVDNARDWATIGGMDVVLTILQQDARMATVVEEAVPVVTGTGDSEAINVADLNATATAAASAVPAPAFLQYHRLLTLQSASAWVLGTAAQNNREVQDRARKEGAIDTLVLLLNRTLQEEQQQEQQAQQHEHVPIDADDDDVSVVTAFQLRASPLKLASKVLYALSALLRNNALNQEAFLAAGGVDALKIRWVAESWLRCVDVGAPTSWLGCLSEVEAVRLKTLRVTVTLKSLALVHDIVVDHTVNAVEAAEREKTKAVILEALQTAQGHAEKEQGAPAVPAGADATDASAAPADTSSASSASYTPPADPLSSDLSSPSLFTAFVTPDWCAHLVDLAIVSSPDSRPMDARDDAKLLPSTSLTIRTHALNILSALTEAAARPDEAALLLSTVPQRGFANVVHQHQQWAEQMQRVAADTTTDAEAREDAMAAVQQHRALAATAQTILQRSTGHSDAKQA